jgi:hypothetical protein
MFAVIVEAQLPVGPNYLAFADADIMSTANIILSSPEC